MPWFHVQLMQATRCNNCAIPVLESLQLLQRIACNNCTRNHCFIHRDELDLSAGNSRVASAEVSG